MINIVIQLMIMIMIKILDDQHCHPTHDHDHDQNLPMINIVIQLLYPAAKRNKPAVFALSPETDEWEMDR